MTSIIPRDLIKHLEWAPGKEPPKPRQPKASQQNSGNLEIKTDFSKYIQVGMVGLNGNSVVISPYELEGFSNMNYENTHVKLLDSGLYMPTPQIFMTHFNNVMDAFKGKRKLIYADGNQVPKDQIDDLYLHLIQNHKNVYGRSDVGAWTWLNSKFVEGLGFNNLDLEIVTGIASGRLTTDKKSLLNCVIGDGVIVDLDFNEQGLPKNKSATQSHVKGSNIYLWSPKQDKVAGFGASSGRAVLSCNGDPSGSGPALGVFGCAEGTPSAGETK